MLNKQQYGETWRTIRKIAHRIFNEAAARSYAPYQDLESKAMLLDFLDRPDEFYDHLRRYSSSLTAQMTYGFRVKNVNDPYIAKLFWVCEPSLFPLVEYLRVDKLRGYNRYSRVSLH